MLLRASVHRVFSIVLIVALVVSQTTVAVAGNFNRNGAVGGISINVDGLVANALPTDQAKLAAEMKRTAPADGALNRQVPLRKISLKALEAACQAAITDNAGQLPDEVKYLGGLQGVEYIMVYPEQNDIVLAGPAEGWTVDPLGNVVGVTTGHPVLQLDDLLIALRSIESSVTNGISVSIDPTKDGYQRLNQVLKNQRRRGGNVNTALLERQMKEAFGPQQVKLSGVPGDSRFARILLAADYQMKRLAMNLDKSPMAGLPSYVDMLARGGGSSANVNPRWWMACDYEPLTRSEDGLAWRLNGAGVKVMTETDYVNESGELQRTGRQDPLAQKWADMMTEKFDDLAQQYVVFAELQNLMDLSIVAAVIEKHDLFGKAGMSSALLVDTDSMLMTDTWNTPKSVAPECSFVRQQNRRGWVVTASGGVQIESWAVASNPLVEPEAKQAYESCMMPASSSWWWN